MKDLVSIIVPVYNAEKYLEESLNSIKNQTYTNWELFLVDDCSTDNSLKILEKFKSDNKEKNISVIHLEKNGGPAFARNIGLEMSKGRYLAYLDADDYWAFHKLEKQISFMENNNIAFCMTDFKYVYENNINGEKYVKMPKVLVYKRYLFNTIIHLSSVVIDLNKINKKLLVMKNVAREDANTWCEILKKGYNAYALNDALVYYRQHKSSLSYNKFKSMKGTWELYRKDQGLDLCKSLHYFCGYAFNAIKKRFL